MTLRIESKDIINFITLQKDLVNAFFKTYPTVKDVTWLLDFPKRGNIKLGHDSWKFIKHGKGVMFLRETPKPEIVIDVHTNIDNPKLVDVWRLSTYFSSEFFEADDNEIKQVLSEMVSAGFLREISESQYEQVIEKMNNFQLMVSVQRSMLFNISPKFRMISFEINQDNVLEVLVIISEGLVEEEKDLAYSFSGEVEGDYPEIESSHVSFLLDTREIDLLPRLKFLAFSLYK
ncbi:DUF6896 domain-containing protein [Limnobaculum xujianqingii]|uniref:DUF6896 domain-containing protein n=1 Tax=Limnobaculum xujianqingii TaxID=2738837 RepID=UPI0015C1BC88|nr:hypothetical protein [Limnobaculum xujianqingii]